MLGINLFLISYSRKLFGGLGIVKFENFEHFMDCFGMIEKEFSEFFLQRFIPFDKRDYRVEIINEEVVGYYSREKNHYFKTNVHQGGRSVPCEYDEEKITLAKKAAKALDIPTTIVDIIQSTEDKTSYVLEVNDCMGIFLESAIHSENHKIYKELAYDDKKLHMLFEYIIFQMKNIKKVKRN